MPTERTDKDPSPPDGSSKRNGGNGGDTSERGSGGIKAKLAAKFRRRPDDSEKKKQLQDYTAWVNNYLKRKPGIPLINDLRTNLQDGVSFVNLVEIVARAEIDGIDRYPTTSISRRTNIEKAVNFLQQDGVTLHVDAYKDIYEGNSKGIMRVILAIAERYQPRSVKPRSVSDPKPYTLAQQQQQHFQQLQREHIQRDRMTTPHSRDHPPMTRTLSPDRLQQTLRQSNLASSAFAANSFSVPNMASLNVHAGSSSFNSQHRSVEQSHSGPTYSPGYGPPHTGHVALSQPERSHQERNHHYQSDPPHSYSLSQDDVENDLYSTPVDQLPPSAGTRIIAPKKKLGVQLRVRSGSNTIRSIPEDREMSELSAPGTGVAVPGGGGGVVGNGAQDGGEVFQEVGAVLAGLNEFKTELLQLHALLLRNSDGSEANLIKELVEGEMAVTPTKETTVETLTAAIPKLTIEQKDKELEEKEHEILLLRDQLAQQQDECTQIESECATLRNMVDERNLFITTMKSEIYRKEYKNDTQRVDLHHQILQKDSVIKQLEGELSSCKGNLEEQLREVEASKTQLSMREQAEQDLRAEIDTLKSELSRLTAAEESYQTKMATKERKIEFLEEKIGELQVGKSQRLDAITAETDAIRESMTLLRSSLSPQDSQQQTIDVLEKNISDVMAKLIERAASPSGKKSRRHRDPDDHHRERDRERRKRHKEKHSSYGEPKADGPPLLSPSGDGTKVFYYMLSERQETPYVTLVPRKSNEVTLRDFKSVFDRHGSFRFFFKTEDPDCGVVKEEIIRDDQLLPRWHGKIMVWISEKSHR